MSDGSILTVCVTCVASRTSEERASLRSGAVLYGAIRRAAPHEA
jgi:hypothetical protein